MSDNLDKAVKALNKLYPDNRVSYLTGQVLNRDTLSTGSIGLDLALGGGVVKGRIIEILGPESSGKTSLAIHSIVEAQKQGVVLYVDTEHSFNPSLAANLGVGVDKLLFFQPDFAEQAFEVIEALIQTGEISLVVLDSVAGLSPRAEFEGDSGDSNMGIIARLLGQHIRKVTPLCSKYKTTIIYINQIRFKIGVIYGNPETTPGGNALKYFASARLDIRKKESLKEKKDGEENIYGIRSRIKVIKNKMAIPFKECEVNFIFNKGIDNFQELVELSIESNVITKSGSWFSYNGETVAQGKEDLKQWLMDNPSIAEEVRLKLFGGLNEASVGQ